MRFLLKNTLTRKSKTLTNSKQQHILKHYKTRCKISDVVRVVHACQNQTSETRTILSGPSTRVTFGLGDLLESCAIAKHKLRRQQATCTAH